MVNVTYCDWWFSKKKKKICDWYVVKDMLVIGSYENDTTQSNQLTILTSCKKRSPIITLKL